MSHKPNMSTNTIFAAVLIAGITGVLASFISRQVITPEFPHEEAFPIEVTESAGAGGSSGPTGPEPIMALLAAADVAKGEALSKQCAACHDFTSGGPDRVGPNLYGVVGREKGTHGSFAYSDDLKTHHGPWSYDDLNHFLWKPKSLIAGTKMNFIGLKKPEDRAAMIAWLNTLGSNKPMPSQAEIDAEQAALAPEVTPAEDAAAAAEGADSKAAPVGDGSADAAKAAVDSAPQTPTPEGKLESPQDGAVEKAETPTETQHLKDDE